MGKIKRSVSLILSFVITICLIVPMNADATTVNSETSFFSMLERAEALVNYEWVPSERIYTWNNNEYNGKNYFEAGETVKGVPYTLFSWELGFDSLLSLEQYTAKSAVNYSTTTYCNSVAENRIGPAYGNCCATFISEVFGGSFMNGSNPRYDGVGTLQNSVYSTTYKNVKINAIQPGDALSCTSGAHIIWVGCVTDENITIYESTPPVCQKVVLDKSSNTDGNGYLTYNGNTYNIVTKSNEMIRDDLSTVAVLSPNVPMPIHAYTKANEKTLVYDAVNGNAKTNKIYGTDLCLIDAVYENGWCHVNFPLDAGGLEHGYVPTSVFFDCVEILTDTAKSGVPIYNRSDLSSSIGRATAGTTVFLISESTNAYQIIFSSPSGGYNLGWVGKDDWENGVQDAYLNQLCPIKGYPCVDENFEVKQSDYSTRGGEIYITDYCTINEIYSDGWCQVTFPMDSGGTKTAYTPISNFIYDVNYQVYSYVTKEQIDVYTKKDLAAYNSWWTGIGDTIYILGECGEALQICYPIDEAYGGGYKLGWIPSSAISIEQEKILDSISISSLPTKTTYYVGEKLDLTGLELLLTYNDGTTDIITENFDFSGYSSETVGEKNITITYENQTAFFTVTILENVPVSPKFELTKATGIAGSTVEIEVAIANNPGIISLRNQIVYDATALELISVSDTGLLNGYTMPASQITSPYTVRWADSFATENNNANGTVVKLTFKIKDATVAGVYGISITPIESRNADGDKILFETSSSTITVIDYIAGDVDGDGEISDWDAILLNRYLAGWDVEINTFAGDVDCDGEISDWDAIVLERYLAGWNIELGN